MITQYRLILLAAALHVSVQAQTQLSTLDGVGDNALSFGAAGAYVSWYGFGFYVGGVPSGFPGRFTPGDFTLASVSTMLSHTSEGAMHAELFLADNVSGLPVGPAVAEFSFSAIGGGSDLVTFTPNASVTVTTDQAYFFGLTPTSGVWNWSLTNDYTGTYSNEDNGWTLIGIAGGGTISGDPVAWSNYSYFDAPRIAIATSAIPEPSTYAAWAGAVGLALAAGWRRRRANVPASESVTARTRGETAARRGTKHRPNFTMKHTSINVDRSWQRDMCSWAGAEGNAGRMNSPAQLAPFHLVWETTSGLGGRAVFFLVAFLLVPFAAQAQDITGMWHVKGLATVAEANPAEITTTDWNGTMVIASLGGGDYRLTFSGDGSAVLEINFTQAGDFFGNGDEIPHEEDEQLRIHQRTGIYFVDATTLLFQRAEAVMRPLEGSEGTLFNFESRRAVLTRVPLPAVNPGGWTGTYESVRGISLGVSNGAGFDEDYLTEVKEYVGMTTAGGYRFFSGESEDGTFNTTLFVAVGDGGLARSATSSGGVLYQDDEWQIERLLEKHDGRAIQMGNGDLVYFGGDGQVGTFGSKNPESGSTPFNLLNRAETEVVYLLRQGAAVTLLTSPESRTVAVGGSTTFTVTVSEVSGTTPAYQWYFNNRPIDGATSRDLTLDDVQPADAGAYHLRLTAGGRVSDSEFATLGLASTAKAAGEAYEFDDDIVHPNGNKYDQVLLTGAAATVTADAGEVTRTSFVDLNDDIVQIEFSGAGTLAISLAADALPANPVKYNQSVEYMKGHATITITGADETSNVSVFTVGRMTAFDPTGGYDMTKPIDDMNKPANNGSPLFKMGESYDGVADVALINISSPTGRFGGVRAANARFYAVAGHTGLFAPGVRFAGPVYLHEVNARDDATPVLLTGEIEQTGEIRITGGNLEQSNARAVRIGSAAKVVMAAGITSHAVELPAQANAGRIERNEADVTDSVVIEAD